MGPCGFDTDIAGIASEDRRMGDYEENHSAPLGLGGAPNDPHMAGAAGFARRLRTLT
jgi:hypothetical protein